MKLPFFTAGHLIEVLQASCDGVQHIFRFAQQSGEMLDLAPMRTTPLGGPGQHGFVSYLLRQVELRELVIRQGDNPFRQTFNPFCLLFLLGSAQRLILRLKTFHHHPPVAGITT
jgi:hypothetical protein